MTSWLFLQLVDAVLCLGAQLLEALFCLLLRLERLITLATEHEEHEADEKGHGEGAAHAAGAPTPSAQRDRVSTASSG